MRASVILVAIAAACATSPAPPPPERVVGCWVSRLPAGTTFMRWRQGETPELFVGELIEYRAGGANRRSRYSLAPEGAGWKLCETIGEANGEGACWAVAESETGSLDGGRAFIDRYRDRLHVAVVGADGRHVLRFTGQREICD